MKYYYIEGLALLAIIYFAVLAIKNKSRNINRTLDYKAEGQNIALGIAKGKALHKKLTIQVHPDRVKPDRRNEANKLMQLINAARYDYSALLALEEEVNAFIKTTQQ
jgi:hypothetical protein